MTRIGRSKNVPINLEICSRIRSNRSRSLRIIDLAKARIMVEALDGKKFMSFW